MKGPATTGELSCRDIAFVKTRMLTSNRNTEPETGFPPEQCRQMLRRRVRPAHHRRVPRSISLAAATFSLLGFLLVLLGPTRCPAQEVTAWVDKNKATLEDQIVLTVSISGYHHYDADPQLPALPDFEVTEGGSSSRTEIVNGRFRSSREYTFLLTPKREGEFTVGPVVVQSRGRSYQSQPIQVKILPADVQEGESLPAYVTQEVDVHDPYVRQQVVYTFRFFHKNEVLDARWEPPSFQGFWVEDLGREKSYETIQGGERYSVTEIKKALFPTSEGTSEIPPSTLACKIVVRGALGSRSLFEDDFFSSPLLGRTAQAANKTLRTKPIRLEVRPLPADGRPETFQGLVGSFDIEARVSELELHTGDSTTLTVTVSGAGDLRDLVSFPPEEIAGFKVYPDKPSLDLKAEGDLVRSSRVFKKALVPLQEGPLQIPALELVYFDPQRGAYRSTATAPVAVMVAKGEQPDSVHLVQSPGAPGTKSSIQVLGRDILPIHTGLAGADTQVPHGAALLLYLSAFLLPPFAYLATYVVKRRKRMLAGDPLLVRKKAAKKKADGELKRAKKFKDGNEPEFYRQLGRTIKSLVGDKLSLSALAYTQAEIGRCLEEHGLKEDVVQRVQQFLQELEYCQYASSQVEPARRESLLHTAKELVNILDRRL